MREPKGKDFLINVFLKPSSKSFQIVNFHQGFLEIRVPSPPIKGKANRDLINFLSEILKVKKSSIKIIKGEKRRKKLILIENFSSNSFQSFLRNQGLMLD